MNAPVHVDLVDALGTLGIVQGWLALDSAKQAVQH